MSKTAALRNRRGRALLFHQSSTGLTMIFKSKNRNGGTASTSAKASNAPTLLSRERMRHVADEQRKATDAVSDLEQRVERLEAIISDAASAHAVLQAAIAQDGGKALSEFASGTATDTGMAELVIAEENQRKAAIAAKSALPSAIDALAAARSEAIRLAEMRREAVVDFLRMRADNLAREYTRTVGQLYQLHDALIGVSAALETSGDPQGEIVMTLSPIVLPNFNLPSGGSATGEYLATSRHLPSEHDVRAAHRQWLAATAALIEDADAAIDHLIGGVS
jgi:hypothetical protein